MIYKEIEKSSSIMSVSYDDILLILEVTFKRGAIYRYTDVPYGIVKEFLKADSAGKYFSKHIAKCFKYEEVKLYG